MADGFADRVAAAVRAHGPLCAGIDPSGALLASWGLSDDPRGLRAFCRVCVEGFAGTVGVIKPQVAFFERHGSAGMAELERLIAEATAAGLIVIATPNGATSTPRRRRTPTHGSATRARSQPTR